MDGVRTIMGLFYTEKNSTFNKPHISWRFRLSEYLYLNVLFASFGLAWSEYDFIINQSFKSSHLIGLKITATFYMGTFVASRKEI